MDIYHINLHRDLGSIPRDEYWTMDEIRARCRNANVLRGKAGITAITVLRGAAGQHEIIQFCGYTRSTGMYGYTILDEAGNLERFF